MEDGEWVDFIEEEFEKLPKPRIKRNGHVSIYHKSVWWAIWKLGKEEFMTRDIVRLIEDIGGNLTPHRIMQKLRDFVFLGWLEILPKRGRKKLHKYRITKMWKETFKDITPIEQ